MSPGLCSLLFATLMVIVLFFSYMLGMRGWIAGTAVSVIGWILSVVLGWADPSLFAMEGVALLFTLGVSLRWVMRHEAWSSRAKKDEDESQVKQSRLQAAVQHLKEKMNERIAEMDHGQKQYELVKKLAEAVSWPEMAPSLEKALKYFFKAEGWALYLTNEKGELHGMQHRGNTPGLSVEDLTRKEAYLQPFEKTKVLNMPLWRAHERIGFLMVRLPQMDSTPDQEIVSEAEQLSTQLIFAMAKAKLFRELDLRSRTDGLTGLARRGPFDERLKEEVARAQSFKSTFSILMIDIDHFKNMNDTYGHQVGDDVLKTVTQRIQECLYETDFIARYGGEEFVCILPRSQPAGLRQKAEQIRQRVADQAFVIGLEAIQVTISLGIAHFPQDGQTAQAILEASDRALYAAKHAGRNRVIEASSIART